MPPISFADVFTAGGLAALGQVVMIDLMLAGDNVVILGTLVARLPEAARRRVLAIGVAMALVFLIVFALLATRLLQVIGLTLAGGFLLLWVAWKLFRELRRGHDATPEAEVKPAKSVTQAVFQVALADLSMSLDNVLAVAGAARDHPTVLLVGLGLSVTLMAVAANYIAKVIERNPWIAYIGLAVIVYVAGSMIVAGTHQVMPHVQRVLG